MQIQFRSTTYDALNTGEYNAELLDVEQVEGQYGSQIRFSFALSDPQYNGRRLTAYARVSESLNGKLAKWVQALLGRALREGETVDFARLIGKPCVLVVLRQVKADGNPFNKVEDVLPAPPPEDPFE